MTIKASDFNIINGGVLQVNVFELDANILSTITPTPFAASNGPMIPSTIAPLFHNQGEILFFKKPSQIVNVEITTDKSTYKPGDLVNFGVAVSNITVMMMNETLTNSTNKTSESIISKFFGNIFGSGSSNTGS
jgi:hypothetical protein